jgi:hypothetical protein
VIAALGAPKFAVGAEAEEAEPATLSISRDSLPSSLIATGTTWTRSRAQGAKTP